MIGGGHFESKALDGNKWVVGRNQSKLARSQLKIVQPRLLHDHLIQRLTFWGLKINDNLREVKTNA